MFRSIYHSCAQPGVEHISYLTKILSSANNLSCTLLPITFNNSAYLKHQQVRTTFVVKRRHPIPPHKFHVPFDNTKVRFKNRIYDDLPESKIYTDPKPVKILLLSPIEGLGGPGDILEINGPAARNHLLLGLAVYCSPENIEKYAYLKDAVHDSSIPSSPFVFKTLKKLTYKVICVSMNMENPWVLEPWHLRVAFRKAGIIVTDEAIIMPEKPIMGPDLDIEGKEFLLRVKINNKESGLVRCRIHHVATDVKNRLPWLKKHWEELAQPIFAEEGAELKEITLSHPCFKPSELED